MHDPLSIYTIVGLQGAEGIRNGYESPWIGKSQQEAIKASMQIDVLGSSAKMFEIKK